MFAGELGCHHLEFEPVLENMLLHNTEFAVLAVVVRARVELAVECLELQRKIPVYLLPATVEDKAHVFQAGDLTHFRCLFQIVPDTFAGVVDEVGYQGAQQTTGVFLVGISQRRQAGGGWGELIRSPLWQASQIFNGFRIVGIAGHPHAVPSGSL